MDTFLTAGRYTKTFNPPVLGIISAIHKMFITGHILHDVYMFAMFTRVSSHSCPPDSSE